MDTEEMPKSLWLLVLDMTVSSVVITPLVVLFYISTCELLYAVEDWFPPLWWSLLGIWVLIMGIAWISDHFYDDIVKIKGWRSTVISRVYIYVTSVIMVTEFGVRWALLDEYMDNVPLTLGAALVALPFLLISGNPADLLLAPPYSLGVDRDRSQLYKYERTLNWSSQNIGWYLLDCVFSVCVVGTLVVFVWRGHWTLLELYLYPGKPKESALASLAIGYLIVVVTFLLQPVMKYFARTLKGISRLIVVDIYLLISFSGTINVWRGIWNTLNVFFLPELPLLSFFITHSLCFLLLVLINSSNSILVRGVYVDGQEDGEQCVDFPCYYIRLFFQERRRKKLLKASEQRKMSFRPGEVETLMVATKTPEIVSNHSTPTTPNSV